MNNLWRAIGLGGSSIPNFDFTVCEHPPASVNMTLIENQVMYTSHTLNSDGVTAPWTMRPGYRNEDQLPVTIFSFPTTGHDPATVELARNALKKCKTLMLPGLLRTYDATEYKGTLYIATEQCAPMAAVLGVPEVKKYFYGVPKPVAPAKGSEVRTLDEDDDGPVAMDIFNNSVAYGLKTLAGALNGLHGHGLQHGNVCESAVFITKGAEWRLFGFEAIGPVAEEHSLAKRYASLVPEYRRAGMDGVSSAHPSSYDAWSFGCLIYTVYCPQQHKNVPASEIKSADVRANRSMPSALQSSYMGLLSANVKSRFSLGKFIADCEFITNSEFCQILLRLDDLALMDIPDRDAYYRKLSQFLDRGGIPLLVAKYLILSRLSSALNFGGGTATVLEPILKIGARLSEEEFGALVGPIVVSMFASQDHLVRCRLLSSAQQYAAMLPRTLVSEKIYPHYVTGFTSRHADIRELTVRALIHFAPVLSEKTLVNDVPKHISLLQQDKEGPIRTNATICLSLLAPFFVYPNGGGANLDAVTAADTTSFKRILSMQQNNHGTNSKILVNGFGRMLKDPFIPSKIAALRGILNTMEVLPVGALKGASAPAQNRQKQNEKNFKGIVYCPYSALQLSELLLPAVAPCLCTPLPGTSDPLAAGITSDSAVPIGPPPPGFSPGEVRTLALQCVRAITDRLEGYMEYYAHLQSGEENADKEQTSTHGAGFFGTVNMNMMSPNATISDSGSTAKLNTPNDIDDMFNDTARSNNNNSSSERQQPSASTPASTAGGVAGTISPPVTPTTPSTTTTTSTTAVARPGSGPVGAGKPIAGMKLGAGSAAGKKKLGLGLASKSE